MRAVVFILFVLLVVVVAWFAMANSAPVRGRRRVVRRRAPRQVVTRRTVAEEVPEAVEE